MGVAQTFYAALVPQLRYVFTIPHSLKKASPRHHPEWPDDIPLFKDWEDCLNYTKNTVKRGQRYIMQFNWIDRTEGHVISVIRSSKGKFFFYDPQEGAIFNREDFKDLFEQIMFSDKYKQPKYIRVDHLQFDENVLKYITEASGE